MKIQVNTDNTVDGGEDIARTVEITIHAALDRYGDRLTRVEAHLGDEDGAPSDQPRGLKCLLEARPPDLDPVVVTGTGDTIEHACHDAIHKMQRLLDSTFGRIDSRGAGATIRQDRS